MNTGDSMIGIDQIIKYSSMLYRLRRLQSSVTTTQKVTHHHPLMMEMLHSNFIMTIGGAIVAIGSDAISTINSKVWQRSKVAHLKCPPKKKRLIYIYRVGVFSHTHIQSWTGRARMFAANDL